MAEDVTERGLVGAVSGPDEDPGGIRDTVLGPFPSGTEADAHPSGSPDGRSPHTQPAETDEQPHPGADGPPGRTNGRLAMPDPVQPGTAEVDLAQAEAAPAEPAVAEPAKPAGA